MYVYSLSARIALDYHTMWYQTSCPRRVATSIAKYTRPVILKIIQGIDEEFLQWTLQCAIILKCIPSLVKPFCICEIIWSLECEMNKWKFCNFMYRIIRLQMLKGKLPGFPPASIKFIYELKKNISWVDHHFYQGLNCLYKNILSMEVNVRDSALRLL